MKSAVILAAGQGTRLRNVLEDAPKGSLKLGEQSIVEESIDRLLGSGIDDVVVVTGYCASYYESLAERYSGVVRTVNNPSFDRSGSMYSLYCARDMLEPPFLLLESDLIYETRALDVLIEHPSADTILLAGASNAGDEVFVETRDGRLHAMSKNPSDLGGDIAGELVGISKISPALFDLMLDIASDVFATRLTYDYETDCLVAAGRRRPIACPVVDDLLWAEIDDPAHLARASNSIYPAIAAAESAGCRA